MLDGIVEAITADEKHEFAVDIIEIVIAVTRLAEEFGIYALESSDPDSDEYQRRFFFILFAIHFVDVFQCLHKSEIYKNIVSMVIDTLKLILYLSILHKTTALYLIAFLSYGFEMALSGIIIAIERCSGSNDSESDSGSSNFTSLIKKLGYLYSACSHT